MRHVSPSLFIVVVVVVVVVVVAVVTFMQCIYNYVPEEANHVCRVYNVAAILWSQLISHYNHFVLSH